MIYLPYSVKLKMGALEICLSVCCYKLFAIQLYINATFRVGIFVYPVVLNHIIYNNESIFYEGRGL